MNPLLRDALTHQVRLGLWAVSQAAVRDLIDEDAIHLLRHTAIEAPEARFEMGDEDPEFRRREPGSERRIDVTGDDHEHRALLKQDLLDALKCASRLPAMRPRSNAEQVVGPGQAEILKEEVGHFGVVVLAGMDDDVPQ